jgi:hypothetical protein
MTETPNMALQNISAGPNSMAILAKGGVKNMSNDDAEHATHQGTQVGEVQGLLARPFLAMG